MTSKQILVLLGLAHLTACLAPAPQKESKDAGMINPDAGIADARAPLVAEGDPATIALRGPCELADRVGGFSVEAYHDYSIVEGKVANSVVPAAVRDVFAQEGDCRLLKRRSLFCTPTCETGTTCDVNGSCIDYPEQQNLGQVTIAGLKKDIYMDPMQPGNTYFDTNLPHPAFSSGSLVQLRTTTGTYGAMELNGVGMEPLEILGDNWTIAQGQSLEVRWQTPTEPGRAKVWLELTIDQHGSSPVSLDCQFEDDGEAEIPSSLIDEMYNLGVSGFPNGGLSRQTLDSLAISDGCIDFKVATPTRATVRVSGHIPCNNQDDCPSGLTCDTAQQTCI